MVTVHLGTKTLRQEDTSALLPHFGIAPELAGQFDTVA